MDLENILRETRTNELLRAYNSQKEFIYIDVSFFNVGISVWLKCTDTYKEINYNTWNGYNCFIDNDFYFNELIENEFKLRLSEITDKNQIKRVNNILKA